MLLPESHSSFNRGLITGWHSVGQSRFSVIGEGNITFGMEIEVEARFANAVITANSIDHYIMKPNNIEIFYCRDGTISGVNGVELLTQPYSWSAMQDPAIGGVLFDAVSRINAYAKGFYGSQNGLHIHVGKSAFNEWAHLRRVMLFHANNTELVEFIAQRGQTGMWQHTDNSAINSARGCWNRTGDMARYTAVNANALSRMGTIEFRYFKPNLKVSRMRKAVEWLHSLIKFTENLPSDTAVNVEAYKMFLIDQSHVYPNLYKYLETRLSLPSLITEATVTVSDVMDDIPVEIVDPAQVDIMDILADLD